MVARVGLTRSPRVSKLARTLVRTDYAARRRERVRSASAATLFTT